MLKKNLVQKYGLDPLKTWDIIDRDEDLCLLGGFYAGTILSSTEELIIPWEINQWIIERVSEPLTNKIFKDELLESYRGGSGRRKRNHPIIGATRPQPYRSTEFLIPHGEQGSIPHGALVQAFPDGVVTRYWKRNGNVYLSTRNKLHDVDIYEKVSHDLEEFGLSSEPTLLIISLPELSISMRQPMQGIYTLGKLKTLGLAETNEWMGFSKAGDWRLSDGESCLVTFENGERTLLKPTSKVWRESIITGNSFPDSYILGLSIFDVQDDIYSRFVDLTSVGAMDSKTYEDFWPLVDGSVNEPYEKISNSYFCLVRSLSLNRETINYYQKWFGTEPFNDFTDKILELENSGTRDLTSEAKLQMTRSSDLELLILKTWEQVKNKTSRNKLFLKISKATFEEEGDPFLNFLQFFIFSPSGLLDGIQLNRLRKI